MLVTVVALYHVVGLVSLAFGEGGYALMAQEERWKRDGWEATVRIGVLTPHADVGPESELQAMAPPGVAIHATRVPFGAMAAEGVMDPTIPLAPVRAFAEPPHLDDRMRTIINVS